MRYTLPDGYIDINEEEDAEGGNTYCGETAHNIMFQAQRIQRENRLPNYQGVLRGICEGINNGVLTIIKGRN